jgi:hypothetical protein
MMKTEEIKLEHILVRIKEIDWKYLAWKSGVAVEKAFKKISEAKFSRKNKVVILAAVSVLAVSIGVIFMHG